MNEAITLYINAQFENLPKTPEVTRAHQELLQMSEDKYTELIASGMSEHEATGRVITEFGNLSELADDLGIRAAFAETSAEMPTTELPVLSRKEADSALAAQHRSSYLVAAGVVVILLGALVGSFTNGVLRFDTIDGRIALNFTASTSLLIGVAIAVPLFIMNFATNTAFRKIDQAEAVVDYETSKYFAQRREANETRYSSVVAAGVAIIIFGVILATMNKQLDWAILAATAIATPMFIINGMHHSALKKLALAGPQERNKRLARCESDSQISIIAMVYWPATIAAYALWSFLGNAWHLSWIIWPVSGVMFGAIAAVVDARAKTKHRAAG